MKRGKPSLNYVDWYSKIKEAEANKSPDYIDLISKAIEFFEEEKQNSEKVFHQGDKLLDVYRNYIQYCNYYNNLHTQLELLDNLFELRIKQMKAKILKEWERDPPTSFALSKIDKSNLAEDDDRVEQIRILHDSFHALYKHYCAILRSLETAGFGFTNITKLRAAGQEYSVL